MADNLQSVRSYEISVWTLQDECITVLKPSELEFKGEVQSGIATFIDDGTEELTFNVPMYYRDGGILTLNPAWQHILNGHFTANMHKIKLIFNKATEDEKVYEMLITNVAQEHQQDQVIFAITCQGLAFHELGKLGYKISLSSDTFEREYSKWFEDGQKDSEGNYIDPPHATIQYWNDKIFKYDDGTLKYMWDYEVNMDWSGYSNGADRDPHKVYEEEYVASWSVDPFDYVFSPTRVEGFREKWRQMDEEESNIYNLTQAIAEKFGVYCRYEYEHDVNYHITGRKVIYYNSALREQDGYTDLTYPYNAARVQRNIDNTDTITKLFVRPIESDSSSSNLISITNVEGNPSKEDYLLNFDYLHEVHTITDDQYEQVHIYEGQLREINEHVVELEDQILLVQEELVKVRADYATYTNAIKLDTERLNNAILLYQQLTGNLEYIEITAANPAILPLYKISSTSNGYYVKMPNEGIIPATVNMYTTIDYSKGANEGRLTGLIKSGEMIYDEFNNLSKITNIYIDNEEQTRIYMTYNYSPKLYYEKVQKTWEQRLASDTANQYKADIDIRSLELLLYSADMDYAHADYATADAASVNTSVASEDLKYLLEVKALDYNPEMIDFNYRSFWMDNKPTPKLIRHRGWNVDDAVQTRNIDLIPFVYGGYDQHYVIVNPVLPGGDVIREYDYGARKYVYNEVIAWADAYAHNLITLDTSLHELKPSLYSELTFRDVYVATVDSISLAEQIIEAYTVYDNSNITSTCALVGDATTDYTYADNGYVDKATADEAHGYVALYDYLLEEKFKIITNFEKWMGPAVREGYWQADDYNDYGNKYSEKFIIDQANKPIYDGATKPELINFTWDTSNVFTGETNSYYEISVNQNKEYYVMVDLRPYLKQLYNYTETLCFIYYSTQFLDLNNEIKDEMKFYEDFIKSNQANMTHEQLRRIIQLEDMGTLTESETAELTSLRDTLNTNLHANELSEDAFIKYKSANAHRFQWEDAIERNENAAMHWFTIDSQCEFGYVYCNDDVNKVYGYIPVLILTGIKDLTVSERLSIVHPYPGYEPFLGTINTDVITARDDTGKQYSYVNVKKERINPIDTELQYINMSGVPQPVEYVGVQTQTEEGDYVIETQTVPHTIKYINHGGTTSTGENDALIAYPRIRINSLELKNNSSDILMSLNSHSLTYIEDYYVLVKLDQADNEHKYFITIKPKMFIRYAYDETPTININYTTSNASEAVYLDAIKVMKENAYPKVSYEVDLNVLNPYMTRTAYSRLRNIVHINDYELQLDKTTGYISKITLDLDQPQNDKVEIKNYETKFEDLFSTIVAQSENMKKNENTISIAAAAFSPGGTLYTSVLQESILKADLNYSFNQGYLTIDEDNGIWGTSNSGVVAFRGGGIFTASTKGPNGEWEWNTGILPTGINADLITTGRLDTNKIRIYAGNKVAFQMNGEGIFAYKTFAKDQNIVGMNSENAEYYMNGNDDLDPLQYVTYNENGLFLTSLSGTKILSKDKTRYIDLDRDVNRVEISWDGLILRNWENERTFFADPDTGNLNITGRIKSYSGEIGSWNITDTGLEGTYIKFLNDAKNTAQNGIFLTDNSSNAQKTVTYNDDTYYAYKIKNNESNKVYYYNIQVDEHIVAANNSIITYKDIPVSCRPRYLKDVIETIEITVGKTVDENGNETDQTTTLNYKKTFVADGPNGNIIMYGGAGIVYDGSEALTSDWYDKIEKASKVGAGFDLNTYVAYAKVAQLMPVDLTDSSEGLTVGDILVLDTYKPTFSVYAQSGLVEMNIGRLGLFELKDTYITGNDEAELWYTKVNGCDINSSTIDGYETNYGQVITNIWGDSSAGNIHFRRVNGDESFFNVADMYYYRTNISAAQVTSLSMSTTVNGAASYVHAIAQTAISNIGTQYTNDRIYYVPEVWNAVTVDSITGTQNTDTMTVTATAANGKSKTETLSAGTIWNNGYYSVDSGTVTENGATAVSITVNVALENGKSFNRTVITNTQYGYGYSNGLPVSVSVAAGGSGTSWNCYCVDGEGETTTKSLSGADKIVNNAREGWTEGKFTKSSSTFYTKGADADKYSGDLYTKE